MKVRKDIFRIFIVLYFMMQGVWAMWSEEATQENIFSVRHRLLKDTGEDEISRDLDSSFPGISLNEEHATLSVSKGRMYKENEFWNTISDFLASGKTWNLSSGYQYQQSDFSQIARNLRMEILKIQRVDKKNPLKKWECLEISYATSDPYRTSDFILKNSFRTQLHDHQLRERIYVFSEINSALHHSFVSFNEKDLTVLDVDDTLTWFLDPFYSEHAAKNTPLYKNFTSLEKNVQNRFFHWWLTTAPSSLIESQVVQLISTLQEKELKVMALTALRPQFFPEESGLTNLPRWRIELLKKFGIDFSKSFSIPSLGWHFDKTSKQHFPEPYFEKGILFSGLAGKPTTLFNFLRTVQFKPKRVLFVDDSFFNVVSVYRELTRLDIKCYAVLYTRTHKYPSHKTFSEEEFRTCLKKQEKFVGALIANPQPLP